MKRPLPLFFAGLLLAGSLQAGTEPTFPFVLPWDDATPGITDMSGLIDKPAGGHGFVAVKGGHFFAGEKRIRFFGVNTAFGANFPTHGDAEKIAARMAKFGINCVRFHHMDSQAAPNGIWSADLRTLDVGQLDKLDYFIAQLKAHGIYADLNLHVSRTYPGMPEWKGAPSYFKGVDLFYPPMIALQHDYARQLLRHVNPYTKTAYADEPAVALVEINNEDGLICEWWGGALDAMPAAYRAALETPWNHWLQTKYQSQAALQKAWDISDEPLGSELLREGDFAQGLGTAWNLEQHAGAYAYASGVETDQSASGAGLRVRVKKPGTASWHVQLAQSKIAVTQGKSYTLTFRAVADTDDGRRRLNVVASQAHAPWQQLWSTEVALTPEWKEYRFTFQPSASDENARIVFSGMGTTGADYRFATVSLRSGGCFGVQEGEQLGTMPFFQKSGFTSRTTEAQHDWMRFLSETEEGYWTGMQRFLKDEIKTRSLLVGTAVGFSTAPIQARLDAVDSHAYWQHPHFPGKPWDSENWTVQNVSMAGVAGGGTLPGLALRRVEGKPFICTEYNAPAPNSYSAETFLLANAFAGLQDWDGLFAFAYSHRHDDWNSQRIGNFFDIDQNPAKLVTLPAAVAMFVRGDVAKASVATSVPVSRNQAVDTSLRQGSWWTLEAFGVAKPSCFEALTQMQLGNESGSPRRTSPASAGGNPAFVWDSAHACTTVNTPRSKAFIGQGTGAAVSLGEVTIAQQGWASIALTAMDGRDFHSPGHVLITAVGSVESTGMHWKSTEKNSVGRDWGSAPTLAEGITARITLPVAASKLKAWALDERGQRKREVALRPDATGAVLELGPEHQTLWYEVEIEP